MGIVIREVDFARDLDALMEVFDECFNMRSTRERFEWLYVNNPDGRATAWFVINDETGEVAGCTAVFPRRVRVAGMREPVAAWNCGDFAIRRRYRTMGAAVKLRRAAKDGIDAGQSAFLYAHPNDRMLAVHMRAGHRVLGRMVRYARPLRLRTGSGALDRTSSYAFRWWKARPFRRAAEVDRVMDGRLPRDLDVLDDMAAGRNCTALVRDTTYLEWRFLRNPVERSEFLIVRRNGRPVGYLVYVMKGEAALAKDWLAVDESARYDLFADLLEVGRQRDAASVSVVALETHPDLPALRRQGFLPRPDASSAVTYVAESHTNRGSVVDPKSWYMTVGDRDV